MFRSMALGAVGALTLAVSANAADVYGGGGFKDGPPEAPLYSWTGFYVGGNGGYGWESNLQGSYAPYNYPLSIPTQASTPGYNGLRAEGGFGGGQIGYNWQGYNPHLVVGVELDLQGSGIHGDASPFSGFNNAANTNFPSGADSISLDWFGTVRGRIGYATTDRALIYFTGGFAFGGLRKSATIGAAATGNTLNYTTYNYNGTVSGYVLGAGVEFKINHAWSAKLEYQYLDFGKETPVDAAGVASPASYSDESFHTVRAGLNYHFFSGYEPLK